MRLLVIDAALGRGTVAIVEQDEVRFQRHSAERMGLAGALPVMLRDVLTESGLSKHDFDAVAATVGPGSFTGIRAGLSLAMGYGFAAEKPVIPVSIGEAMALALPHLGHRTLWTAINSRRNHVFLEIGASCLSLALDALPRPATAVAVAGDAAIEVAARLAAWNNDVMLSNARFPSARAIAAAAAQRVAGILPPRAAEPLYVDPPEAKLPAGGLRPPPVP